jgi:hypothetical protein
LPARGSEILKVLMVAREVLRLVSSAGQPVNDAVSSRNATLLLAGPKLLTAVLLC